RVLGARRVVARRRFEAVAAGGGDGRQRAARVQAAIGTGRLRMEGADRRLAGILGAGAGRYSAIGGKEGARHPARVRTLRTDLIEPLAASYGGRLFKTTGDGFLAAYASAVQALRCAVAIQERLRADPDGLRLRIGVHQGEVVAE